MDKLQAEMGTEIADELDAVAARLKAEGVYSAQGITQDWLTGLASRLRSLLSAGEQGLPGEPSLIRVWRAAKTLTVGEAAILAYITAIRSHAVALGASVRAWQSRCRDIGDAANEAAANAYRECTKNTEEAVARAEAAESALSRAREEMRERCARVCEGFQFVNHSHAQFYGYDYNKGLAAAIRSLPLDGEKP